MISPTESATHVLPAPSLVRERSGTAIAGVTIFLGAFLLFQLEPMIAKLILPWFGGSAVVWTACMLFFQMALLGGYGYAHWMGKQNSRRAHYVHIALLALSLFLLPIIPSASWKPLGNDNPLPRILGLLAATVGVPYTLLSATSPLVQAWYSRRNSGKVPYRLFSLSNLASLIALVSYPVVIEPLIPATVQAVAWSVEYALFAMLASWFAYQSAGSFASAEPVEAAMASAAISWKRRATLDRAARLREPSFARYDESSVPEHRRGPVPVGAAVKRLSAQLHFVFRPMSGGIRAK